MSAEQKQPFAERCACRLVERRAAAAAAAAGAQGADRRLAAHQPNPPQSHWHFGSENFIVLPQFVQQALATARALPSSESVHDPEEFAVKLPQEDPPLGGDIVLDPCAALGRNVCRLFAACSLHMVR